jgi:cysteinyl-tRNA synthetase
MTGLRLYNTTTRTKEDFVPIDPNHVRLYVCGPTVYDLAHLGNARPVVVFDVLARLLRSKFPRVTYVRNITDVDDKIFSRARESGESISSVTARTTADYHRDMAALNNLPPDVEPRATAHIAEMIALTERLIANGHAYAAEGHVLFSVPSYAAYGKLANRSTDEMLAGARIDVAPYKRSASDFVLWKPSDAETPGWDSPWGRGRPGWHIECSAMAWRHLGESFDIHGGGLDLIFPHHENEIAQSLCAFPGSQFARVWMHNGMLNVDGEKMSKSLGNFLTVQDVLAKGPWAGEAYRLLLLKTHYRQPIDFSWAALEEAKRQLDRWQVFRLRVESLPAAEKAKSLTPHEAEGGGIEQALMDDLNTPRAIAAIDALVSRGNLAIEESPKDFSPSIREIRHIKSRLRVAADLMGLLQDHPVGWLTQRIVNSGTDDEIFARRNADRRIDKLVAERNEARLRRDFKEADRIRDQLASEGIVIKDGPKTSTWMRS